MIKRIEFVDPNLPSDIEKILPSILAQALINKLQNENITDNKNKSA
ncbi:hypothetical protein [Ruminiclostridium cellulolyticum]|uniref:Uncharacterized protein n=1 Tax=Ruminiclostridium cellulolyticum (strain ATCC 35319 / DSM 5812 / JCM 6584 / H10) TaxID=394503 RepID=B8I077_RUMCH|nr:hypothetical protein [Ruminiclostridium cellulolyticum]ACL77403.1 hypothetical protein Ccel_3112 [Ruminiclostridium cellulolyticum H10]